jgi:chemosensory pili system protein ChpA (sensor histidine kinase/response regulator)
MMAESVNDGDRSAHIATPWMRPRTILLLQARQTRELQRDLLRTRMWSLREFPIALPRGRQASNTGKQVKLDLLGGTIEMDRGMLDRMTPALSICCATA